MNKATFGLIWELLDIWRMDTKTLFDSGIDTSKHDKGLYDIVIILLETYFNRIEMDFIIWSIFDDVRELPAAEGNKKIDTVELCWEYLQKLKENKDEVPS